MKFLQSKWNIKIGERKSIINQGDNIKRKTTVIEEEFNVTLSFKNKEIKETRNIDNLSNIINHIILNISTYQILETTKKG